MLKDTNYITIQAWMRTKLGLTGLELMVYAIIYGFCQVEGHYFNGSVAYIMEWTGASRSGVMKVLSSLTEKGLLKKENDIPTNRYSIMPIDSLQSKPDYTVDTTCLQSSQTPSTEYTTPCLQSSHNNINNNIDNNKYNINREVLETVDEIVSYLNKICKTKFRSNTASVRKLIKARLNEGFTVEDFKKVIDKKYEDWGRHPKVFTNGNNSADYLRPQTLFGDKFDSYLNESNYKPSNNSISQSKSVEILDERADFEF